MTGAVRSLQWTIQDMNGSVEHLGHSHDHLRRAQNIMAWTTAIFGALLLSGLVWIANDIFHLKDQLMESDRRFDTMDAQMTALGSRMDDLNIAIEQLGAELLANRSNSAPVSGPDVSVLSTPNTPESFQAAANAPLEATAPDAAAQPQLQQPQAQQQLLQQQAALQPQVQGQQLQGQQQLQSQQVQQQAALAPAGAQGQAVQPASEGASAAAVVPAIAPSPPAPRDQLTPEELAATPDPVLAAAAPAAQQTAPAAAASGSQAAAAPAAAVPAPSGANLSDDQLLSFNDDQIDPADELLLLDENGNPQ